MQIVGLILTVVGGLVALVGGIMFLVVAFRESIWWGLACLFIPLVSLIFLILHWSEAKKAFLIQLAGMAIVFLGVFLGGSPSGSPP